MFATQLISDPWMELVESKIDRSEKSKIWVTFLRSFAVILEKSIKISYYFQAVFVDPISTRPILHLDPPQQGPFLEVILPRIKLLPYQSLPIFHVVQKNDILFLKQYHTNLTKFRCLPWRAIFYSLSGDTQSTKDNEEYQF